MIAQRINVARRILTDWLGKGGQPVATELAQQRANICQYCVHNYKGHWLYNMATQLVINAQSQLRRTMNLKLANEDNLHICDLCGCQLKLKLFVPFIHLYAHTSDEQFARYPEWCWQKQELLNLNKNKAPICTTR